MGNAWIYGRRLVEWLVIFALGHGIILYLATIEIFPDRLVASMITTAVAAPAWAHWIMAALFGLLGTFLLERFLWNRYALLAGGTAAQPDTKISDAIDYIVNDSKTIFEKPKHPETPNDRYPGAKILVVGALHTQARQQVSDKINIGEVKAWGRRQIDTHIPNQFELSVREIPLSYWDDMQLDFHTSLFYRGPYSQTTKIPGRDVTFNWADIKVNRSQIETIWPKKSIFVHLYDKICKQRTPYPPEYQR